LLCRLAARKKKLLLLPLHLLLKHLPLLRLPRLLHLLLKHLPLLRPLTLLLHKLLPPHPTLLPPLPLLLPQRPKPPAPLLQQSNQHSDLRPAFWPVFFRLVKVCWEPWCKECGTGCWLVRERSPCLRTSGGNQASMPVQPKPSD
jgi:hypothetical protein